MRKLAAAVTSGLLLGLSVPSFSPMPLGFLAWFWLVPILFEIKQNSSFKFFLSQTLVALSIAMSLLTLWVANASIKGFVIADINGILVWMIPLLAFYLIRRFLGWNFALLSLPFIWTLWEWFYHSTEISFGAVRLGYMQAEMLYFIQFADIVGVDGVTFWVVTLNILTFLLFEKVTQSEFAGKTFSQVRMAFGRQVLVVFVAIFLPLGYAVYVFNKPSPPDKEITVLAIQPNVSPFLDFTPRQSAALMLKPFTLTEAALKTNKPDLIIWHEVAIPYTLSEDEKANRYLANYLTKWNTPLLLGVFENNGKAVSNGSFLFTTDQIENGKIRIDLQNMYAKRRLMPFIERVPYIDTFPSLAGLIIPIGTRPFEAPGTEAKTFSFQTKDGQPVRSGTVICYENLYPELSADLVRNGAEFLASITNEGWFGNSHGQLQLAAFSRFRSIETRREMVRVGATGVTWMTDKFGRIKQQVPPWSEQTMFGTVKLSDEMTFYVSYTGLFPLLCGGIFLILLVGKLSLKMKMRRFKI